MTSAKPIPTSPMMSVAALAAFREAPPRLIFAWMSVT